MDPLCAQPADPRWLAFCRAFTPWALAHGARTSLTQARTRLNPVHSPGRPRRRTHQLRLGACVGRADALMHSVCPVPRSVMCLPTKEL